MPPEPPDKPELLAQPVQRDKLVLREQRVLPVQQVRRDLQVLPEPQELLDHLE